MASLEDIRTQLEGLHATLAAEALRAHAGLYRAPGAALAALARYSLPAKRAAFEQVRQAARAVSGQHQAGEMGADSEQGRLWRLFFACVDAHLRWRLAPLEAAAAAALASAVVEVNGARVPCAEAAAWLQREGESGRRSRFMLATDGALAAANPVLRRALEAQDRLLATLGLSGYLAHCQAKLGFSCQAALPGTLASLGRTEAAYLARLTDWAGRVCRLPLSQLTHADAVYLSGCRPQAPLFPPERLRRVPALLAPLGLAACRPRLTLDLLERPGKGARPVCAGVRVPHDVRVVVRPQGGLAQCQALLHELGHALHLAHTDPALPFEYRSLPRSRSLGEAFAFTIQGLAANPAFLAALGLSAAEVLAVRRAVQLQDLALWRRYGAKLICEVEMWAAGGPDDGRRYADALTRHTLFRYGPAGYLADLEPDLYAADYLLAWMGAAQLTEYLERDLGEGWPLDPRSGEFLTSLWRDGERYTLPEVLSRLGGLPGDPAPLERRLTTPL